MDRKWKSGAVGAPPASADNASDGFPTSGNPGTGVPATKPGAYWYHMITEELLAFVSAAGIAFDKAVLTQVRDALRRMRDTASRVVGADCKNNAATPNTQFDLSARQVVLRNPATGDTFVVRNPVTKTVNIGTAGPAINGRDQAGAFALSSWVHFYWIGKIDGTYEGIASASADDVGPVLPAGYTHWAYAGTVRLDGGGVLLKTRIKGSVAYYEANQSVLGAGTATVETSVSLASFVPPNALATLLQGRAAHQDTAAGAAVALRYVSGSDVYNLKMGVNSTGNSSEDTALITVPNVSQQVFYHWGSAATNRTFTLLVQGYVVSNGGE